MRVQQLTTPIPCLQATWWENDFFNVVEIPTAWALSKVHPFLTDKHIGDKDIIDGLIVLMESNAGRWVKIIKGDEEWRIERLKVSDYPIPEILQ